MYLPRVLAVTAAAVLLISASYSVSAATGGPATSAGKWAATEAPLPANADHTYAQLSSVSCPTTSACTAVGSYTGSGGWQGLLLTKASSVWSAVRAPLPAGAAHDPYVNLSAVNCFSASACAAIGFYYDSSGDGQAVLLTGAGSSWIAVKPPLPSDAASGSGASAGLSAVHCFSATSCLAVGAYVDSAGGQKGFSLTGFGARWTVNQLPVPANSSATPSISPLKMTCTASGCVVLGIYNTSGGQAGLLLTGAGSSWTATEAPVPANANPDDAPILTAVQCQSPSLCTAAGRYYEPSSASEGLLITGFGTSWTATESPLPANAIQDDSVDLNALACPDASECLAVGEYQTDGVPESAGLLVTGSASSWKPAQAPQPGNAAFDPNPVLEAVACTSAAACVASGRYGTAAGNVHGLLIYGGASSWTAIQAPVPPNAGGTSDVPAVSCVKSASACVAVGSYYDQSGNEQGLVLTGTP
jgi:hypothetical protein